MYKKISYGYNSIDPVDDQYCPNYGDHSLIDIDCDYDPTIDSLGMDPDEIQTVMNQANCSYSKAVKALKKYKNIVDAILALSP